MSGRSMFGQVLHYFLLIRIGDCQPMVKKDGVTNGGIHIRDSVFCVFCGKNHKLSELEDKPFFSTGKAYFCGEEQIARSKDGRLVYWNGKNFEDVR